MPNPVSAEPTKLVVITVVVRVPLGMDISDIRGVDTRNLWIDDIPDYGVVDLEDVSEHG